MTLWHAVSIYETALRCQLVTILIMSCLITELGPYTDFKVRVRVLISRQNVSWAYYLQDRPLEVLKDT